MSCPNSDYFAQLSIKKLQLTNFRNFPNFQLSSDCQFIHIYGRNGSGKTSILEAIHYLSYGRSFRTQNTNRLVRDATDSATVYCVTQDAGQNISLGAQRFADGEKKFQLNNQSTNSVTELLPYLPAQYMGADAYRLVVDGPVVRRKFLDWGVFHVKHSYLQQWQQVQKGVKHRNALLKMNNLPVLQNWDYTLSQWSHQLDINREEYFLLLRPIFYALIKAFELPDNLELRYERGWPAQTLLFDVLQAQIKTDLRRQFTSHGPHRADLSIKVQQTAAQDVLSQGQQKLVAYALRLAQGLLLHEQKGKAPVFLIDDLPSELDSNKQELVLAFLHNLSAQVFITSTEPEPIKSRLEQYSYSNIHL